MKQYHNHLRVLPFFRPVLMLLLRLLVQVLLAWVLLARVLVLMAWVLLSVGAAACLLLPLGRA